MSVSMSNKATKINKSDLKIFPSERLTDHDDGGGLALGTPIQGVANELFNPISSIARVNGAFHTRLIYAGVQRPDDEPLIAPFVALTKPPQDPSVSYLLFKASKFGEMRQQALKRIEAYNVATIESRMTLLSTQSKYSNIVQAYQRQGEPLPLVGDVYCLRQDKKGYENIEQYVQVVSVKSEDRTFTNPQTNKDFVRTVVQLEIGQKLEHDFVGADYPSEYYIDNPCKLRETHVADAGNYYGIKPLVRAITAQSAQIQISGLMEKLVPTNQVETSLIDLSASGQRQTLIDGSKNHILINIRSHHNSNQITQYYVGNAILPASLSVQTSHGSAQDVGGSLVINGQTIGSVSYGDGTFIISEPTWSGYIENVSFKPATADLQVADTAKLHISINNRAYNYVLTLSPIPAVGSLVVSYRSQGQWYDLRDNGNGALVGASQAHGSGNINYKTGTLNISCGELPDVDSDILMSWGTAVRYQNRSSNSITAQTLLTLKQESQNLRLEWQQDGRSKTATANGNQITGDVTGVIDGRSVYLNAILPAQTQITATYSSGDKTHQQHKAPLRNRQGQVTIDLGDVPIQPNSVRLRWNLLIEDYQHITLGEIYTRLVDPYKTVRDDGNGKLIDDENHEVGTIDYQNRRLTFNPDTTVMIPKATYSKTKIGEKVVSSQQVSVVDNPYGLARTKTQQVVQDIYRSMFTGYEYIPAGASMPIDETALVEVWFYDTSSKTSTTETLTVEQLQLKLLQNYAENIAPSSLHFSQGNQHYFDKLGQICTYLDPKTGSSRVVGTVNYADGTLILRQWTQHAFTLNALVTSVDLNPVDSVTFRTPTAPIRPASLQIRAIASDGTPITATANLKGEINGTHIMGVVDVETGVATVKFGDLVNVAGNENQSWYNAAAVVDGKIFKPKHVLAHSITYNAVAYSSLPVDSSIVKINTARLPQDGRVPIFRRGDTILISNTQSQNIGSAFQSGQTVQLDRTDLDRICVQDSNGKAVNAELWDYDLDAGTITFVTPLDLSGYQMPLMVKHTQEERNRIVKCDIDGTLSLIFPTKRDYPLEHTYVSSVLISDTLQVRATVPFTQRNWNNLWQDFPQGEQLLNKLNVKDYPIVLTDDGAITERWLIKWTSSSQFELYGETLGFVLKTDTLQDLAPINPSTKKPYFTIPKQAFGNDAPWATQDVIRFNTEGTLMPVWVLCAVQPSTNKQQGEDGFSLCLFGDTTEV